MNEKGEVKKIEENIKRILEKNKMDIINIEYFETSFTHHFTVTLNTIIITFSDIKYILKSFPKNFENIIIDKDTNTLALSLHFFKKGIKKLKIKGIKELMKNVR
ncbi:MAG: hypothetical protein QXM27_02870 [Candidatus Pacearchaeota archaeon]